MVLTHLHSLLIPSIQTFFKGLLHAKFFAGPRVGCRHINPHIGLGLLLIIALELDFRWKWLKFFLRQIELDSKWRGICQTIWNGTQIQFLQPTLSSSEGTWWLQL